MYFRNNEYKNLEELASSFKIPLEIFNKRYIAGWSIDDIVNMPVAVKYIEFEGVSYFDYKSLCSELGLDYILIMSRLGKYWMLSDAVHTDASVDTGIVYKGVYYKSFELLEEAFGFKRNVLKNRIRNKKATSIDEALALGLPDTANKIGTTRTYYVQGKPYLGFDALEEAFGISKDTIKTRIKRGWSLEKAVLTKVRESRTGTVTAGDIEYENAKVLAISRGINPSTLSSRIMRGWSLEQALELYVDKPVVYNNKEYTIEEFASLIKASVKLVRNRIAKGVLPVDIIKAISSTGTGSIPCTYKGVEYPSIRRLSKEIGMAEGTLSSRLANGWSIEKAVETPVKRSVRG